MSITYGTVVREVRGILQDEAVPLRYPDQTLVDAINLAIDEMWRIRPDLFHGPSLLAGQPPHIVVTLAAPAPVIDLPAFYHTSLVAFVAGWAELRDDQFTQDGRAATLLKAFSDSLRG